MKYKHAEWRKLYREEQGAFAQLPWFARAAAAELLKPCDDAGRIHVGPLREGEDVAGALMRVIAFRMGATRGDRRLMVNLFPLLFTEGYLVHRGEHVVVRNFVAAQRRWDADEEPQPTPADNDPTTTGERPSNEATTTEQRSDHDGATTEQRPSYDGATKSDLTPRKHSDDDASARARALSSVLSSSVPSSSDQRRERETAPPLDSDDADLQTRITEADRKADASAGGLTPPDVLAMTIVRASGDVVLMSMDPHVLVRLASLARNAVGGPLGEWDFGVYGEAIKHRKVFAWWWKDKPQSTKIPLDYIVGRDDGAKFYEGMAQAHAWSRELAEVQRAG